MSGFQFSLFGWQKPVAKVPISKERIEEVKKLIAKKDGLGAVQVLREVRYKLEAFEQRISYGNVHPPKTESKGANGVDHHKGDSDGRRGKRV